MKLTNLTVFSESESDADDGARIRSLRFFGDLSESECLSDSRSDPDERPEPESSIPDSSVIPGAACPGFNIGSCGSATGPYKSSSALKLNNERIIQYSFMPKSNDESLISVQIKAE